MKLPPWRNEALALLKEGKTAAEAGKRFGCHPSRVTQVCSDNWPGYMLRDAALSVLRLAYGINRRPTVAEAMEAHNLMPEILEGLMSNREFKATKLFNDGRVKQGVVIECSKKQSPDCKGKEEFYIGTGSKPNPTHAANNFRHKGWVVGGSFRADICPACRAVLTMERRDKKPADIVSIEEHSMQQQKPATKPQLVSVKPTIPVSQITLKDIGKSEKRLIDMKLDEVYDADKGGYQGDWSDDKVADDLKCMVEWVALVRSEFHGPNVFAMDLTKELEALGQKSEAVMTARREVNAALEKLEEQDKIVNDRLSAFETAYKEFMAVYGPLQAKLKQAS